MSDYIGRDTGGDEGTVATATQEASKVKDTAVDAAKDVAGTAKDEAVAVASTVRDEARTLYAASKREVADQAARQQERLAAGLESVGEQFGAMAQGADTGLAGQLVQQASDRLGAVATWLQDRDPASVLDEVKAFARRRPGLFIVGAAVAGIVVGRLTRALASGAADAARSTEAASGPSSPPAPASPVPMDDVAIAAPYDDGPGSLEGSGVIADGAVVGDTPLYDESRSGSVGGEVTDDRRDTV